LLRHVEALTLVLRRCPLIPTTSALTEALQAAGDRLGWDTLLPLIQSNLANYLNKNTSRMDTMTEALGQLSTIPALTTKAAELAKQMVLTFFDQSRD